MPDFGESRLGEKARARLPLSRIEPGKGDSGLGRSEAIRLRVIGHQQRDGALAESGNGIEQVIVTLEVWVVIDVLLDLFLNLLDGAIEIDEVIQAVLKSRCDLSL